MRISDWSSDVCSSDLEAFGVFQADREADLEHAGQQQVKPCHGELLARERKTARAFAPDRRRSRWVAAPSAPRAGRPASVMASSLRPTARTGCNPPYATRLRPWNNSSISRLSSASIFIRSLNDRLRAFSSNR